MMGKKQIYESRFDSYGNYCGERKVWVDETINLDQAQKDFMELYEAAKYVSCSFNKPDHLLNQAVEKAQQSPLYKPPGGGE